MRRTRQILALRLGLGWRQRECLNRINWPPMVAGRLRLRVVRVVRLGIVLAFIGGVMVGCDVTAIGRV